MESDRKSVIWAQGKLRNRGIRGSINTVTLRRPVAFGENNRDLALSMEADSDNDRDVKEGMERSLLHTSFSASDCDSQRSSLYHLGEKGMSMSKKSLDVGVAASKW